MESSQNAKLGNKVCCAHGSGEDDDSRPLVTLFVSTKSQAKSRGAHLSESAVAGTGIFADWAAGFLVGIRVFLLTMATGDSLQGEEVRPKRDSEFEKYSDGFREGIARVRVDLLEEGGASLGRKKMNS